MEGITILQTIIEKHATWGFSWSGLFCIIAAIVVFVLCLVINEDSLIGLGLFVTVILRIPYTDYNNIDDNYMRAIIQHNGWKEIRY